MVLARISEGDSLDDIASRFGITRGVMWSYIKSDESILAAYQEAQEAAAEGMVGEVVGIADGSEDAKLRIDTRLKLAKAWNPKRYGDGVGAGGGVGFSGITIVIGDVKPAVEDVQATGEVVEGEVVVI